MLKWYEVYREVWCKETQITKCFVQSLLCKETEVIEEIFEIDWSTIENWYKKEYRPKGLYIVKTKYGYSIAFSEKLFLRGPIVKQWEEPELDLQIRYRYYETFPSIDDIMKHPNKEKVAQWLQEQGIMIQE